LNAAEGKSERVAIKQLVDQSNFQDTFVVVAEVFMSFANSCLLSVWADSE
jgi:hypothetical protein